MRKTCQTADATDTAACPTLDSLIMEAWAQRRIQGSDWGPAIIWKACLGLLLCTGKRCWHVRRILLPLSSSLQVKPCQRLSRLLLSLTLLLHAVPVDSPRLPPGPPPKLLTGIDLHGSPDVNHATSAGAAGVVTKQVYKWGKKYQCLPVVHLRRPLASEFYSQKVIMEGQQQLIGAALPDFSGLIELVSASGTVEPAKVTVVSSFLCITKVKVKGEEVSGASVLVNGKHEHNPCFFAGRRIPDQLGSFDRLRKSLAINCTNFKLLWTFAPAERRENGNNFSNPSVSRCDLPSRALSRHSHPFR